MTARPAPTAVLPAGRPPVLGILRGVRAEQLAPLVDICLAAGLPALEITMNTADAPARIAELRVLADGRLRVGAGTVRTVADVQTAAAAGAEFLVAPATDEATIAAAAAAGLPIVPGALTPSEVERAWQAGAALVKLFPAGAFGPSYVRDLRGPLDDVPLVAVGGVRAGNVAAYLQAGAAGVAVGGSVFAPAAMARGAWNEVAVALRAVVAATSGG